MSSQQQPKAIEPIVEIRRNLELMSPEFEKVLPPHIKPERFIRVVYTALKLNPDLLQCDRQSLYASCMKAANDALLPDNREGAIVPFGRQAQWMPMIAGICKKARNSGEILSIDAQVVYANDQYDSWIDEKGPHFSHRKSRGERGEPVLTYAYALTKDGGFFHEEIDESQMADIEAVSRGKTGPWKGAFRDEMKRKSAIRRLAKYRLPSSTDLDEIIRRDDEVFDVKGESPAQPEAPTRPARLGKIINGSSEQVSANDAADKSEDEEGM